MIDLTQLVQHVIVPTLRLLDTKVPFTRDAAALLAYTAVAESDARYVAQKPSGPALSFWQIEPNTFDDIVRWAFARGMEDRLRRLACGSLLTPTQLPGNLYLACAIARLVYRRAPEPIPPASDLQACARLWKLRYNTPLGRGKESDFMRRAGHVKSLIMLALDNSA